MGRAENQAMNQMTDVDAAALLLRTLLNENATAEIRSVVLAGLEPRDMSIRIEYMMILRAAQRIDQAGRPISLDGLESEFMDPWAAGALLVLRSVHEDRKAGPTDRNSVEELISFLVDSREIEKTDD
jgi:hypothetical protein